MKKFSIVLFLAVLSIPSFAAQFITIGTGGITGTYYPTGGAICRLINAVKKTTGIFCTPESTNGSVFNINSIKNAQLEFGIAQSDLVYQAVKGVDKFKGKKVPKLRAVMAIYPELFTLVTRKDANINNIMDIKGKRINIGTSGSGNETTSILVLNTLGIKKSDLAMAGTLKVVEMPHEMKENRIDGYFYMVGHPTANIKITAGSTDSKLIPIDGAKIDKLIKEIPYYIKASIPGDTYKGNPSDVPTFGVKAVLVTSSDISDKVVYTLVKQVLENFELFKKSHPAFLHIKKESLLEGLSAPLHNGAKKYFKEVGLIK